MILSGKSDPVENYKSLGGEKNKVDEVLNSLGCDFVDYIINKYPQKTAYIPSVVICVARYQQQRSAVIDPFVSLLACVYELEMLFGNS